MLILLAVFLLAAAIALTVVAIVQGSDSVALDVFNRDLDTAVWIVFLAGVVAGLIALAGLAALRVGVRRQRARRREVRYLREKVVQQEQADPGRDETTRVEEGDKLSDEGQGRHRPADMS